MDSIFVISFIAVALIITLIILLNDNNNEGNEDINFEGKLGTGDFSINYKSGGNKSAVLLGYDKDGNDINYNGEGHLISIGHTRSGKGSGVIIPNLLEYKGSMIVFDPKGENTEATLEHRLSIGQKCHVIDPWNITGKNNTKYNPFIIADRDDNQILDDSRIISESIIPKNSSVGQAFWDDEARSLIQTLICFEMKSGDTANICGKIRSIIGDYDSLEIHLNTLSKFNSCFGSISRGAKQYLDKAPAEKSGVLSTIRNSTAFMDSSFVQKATSDEGIRFESLFDSPSTVYLVMPVWQISDYSCLVRMILSMAIIELSRSTIERNCSVLFIIDEFSSIGKIASFDVIYSLISGYGVQIWPILQDINQLSEMYPTSWESFIANAAVFQSFGTRDLTTSKYISDRAGISTITLNEKSKNRGFNQNSDTSSIRIKSRMLINPDEVMRIGSNEGIVFIEESLPIKFNKIRYFSDDRFN